jgi:hypothetical protein
VNIAAHAANGSQNKLMQVAPGIVTFLPYALILSLILPYRWSFDQIARQIERTLDG